MKVLYFIFFCLFSEVIYCLGPDNKGLLEGTVADKTTHQPLNGANIVIQEIPAGASCNEEGKFSIRNVPVGYYQVKITMIGYETVIKSQVKITLNQVTKLAVELNPVSIEIGNVEITSGLFETDPERTVSTKKLTPQEIKTAAGSGEDVFRVIHSMPGVTTGGIMNSNLIVRGGAPDENLALLDNIEIYSPLHFGRLDASMGNISIINPDLLESVEFSSGGFPAEFGGKLSSLFELKMKEGNNYSFNTDLNVNMAGFGFYADGPLTKKSTISLSARRGIFDLITSMLGREVMPRYWDAAGKITYDLGKSNKLSLIGFYYKDDVEKTKYDPDGYNPKGRKYNYVLYDVYGSAFGVNWNTLLSDRGYSLTTASVTTNGWYINQGYNDAKNLNGEDLFEQGISLKNETVYKLNKLIELKGGFFLKSINSNHFTWRESDTTDTGFIFNPDTINYNPPAANKSGAFFQTSLRPIEKLILTAGLRAEYYDLIDENVLSPRMSGSFSLTGSIILNAAYAKVSQDPAAYQVELDDLNRNLKSAKAEQYTAGVDFYLRSDIKLSFEAYYKRLSNTFVTSDTSKIITNNGSGTVSGFEIFLQKKMTDNLVGSFSYTYSSSKRKNNNGLPEYIFDYDRPHNLNLVAGYRISDSWQAGIKYTYSTGMPYTPATGVTRINGRYYVVEGNKNSSRLSDYHELDIRIDKKFFYDSWTLNLYLDIWNVYNRKNVIEYVNEFLPDGSLNKRPIYDYGILPVFGISAQF